MLRLDLHLIEPPPQRLDHEQRPHRETGCAFKMHGEQLDNICAWTTDSVLVQCKIESSYKPGAEGSVVS